MLSKLALEKTKNKIIALIILFIFIFWVHPREAIKLEPLILESHPNKDWVIYRAADGTIYFHRKN